MYSLQVLFELISVGVYCWLPATTIHSSFTIGNRGVFLTNLQTLLSSSTAYK